MYITNHLGSTIALADVGGNLVTSYTYEPYGKATQNGAVDDNSRAFTGREDDGNGLLYYRARYYDPVGGRFIAEDPIGLKGGMNLYTYVYDDPLNFADPDGHGAKSWAKALILALRLWATTQGKRVKQIPQELDEIQQVVKRNAKQRRRGNPRPSGGCPPAGPDPNGFDMDDWIDLLFRFPCLLIQDSWIRLLGARRIQEI